MPRYVVLLGESEVIVELERKLSIAIKSGNAARVEGVFEQIYYTYCKLVAYVISKYVAKKQDVEELTDDVFVSFSRAMFNTEFKSIKYYLVCSAKNASVNFVKRNSGKEIVYLDDVREQTAVSVDCSTPFWALVQSLRAVLTGYETQIVVQRAVFGYTFEEMAKVFQCPSSSVRSTFNRALKKCKKGVTFL